MRSFEFGGVEYPESLFEALDNNRLVVFAGAGVSMYPPANLPGFKELTAQIAGDPENFDEKPPFDIVLHRLELEGVKVKERTCRLLKDETAQFTICHESLLKMFGSHDRVKIITTNFDLLFEDAAKSVFPDDDVPSFAVVPGRSEKLNGIVHIHGSINNPSGLVLTATDFGREYISQGSVSKYLLDIFETHSILFGGYSYEDSTMQYLNFALPEKSAHSRFAMVRENDLKENREKWNQLSIVPIQIPCKNEKDYSQLPVTLKELSESTSRNLVDWEPIVIDFARRGAPTSKKQDTLVEFALRDIGNVKVFCAHAKDESWIDWLERKGLLQPLVSDGRLSDISRELAIWLTTMALKDHERTVIEFFARNKFAINPGMADNIHTYILRKNSSKYFCEWAYVLLNNKGVRSRTDMLADICVKASEYNEIQIAIQAFLLAFECNSKYDDGSFGPKSVSLERPKRVSAKFFIDHLDADHLWKEGLCTLIDAHHTELFLATYSLLSSHYSASSQWFRFNDSSFYSTPRSAIEKHEQNYNFYPIDVLIDIASDSLAKTCAKPQQSPVLLSWIKMKLPEGCIYCTSCQFYCQQADGCQ